MESVEPMEDSPENVTQSMKEGDPIDIDDALIQDRPPSGSQGDCDYDNGHPKGQEYMITDDNLNETNQDEGSNVSESDSEESPESPPAQVSVPMEQEYPVVDEEQSLNIRSPEKSYKLSKSDLETEDEALFNKPEDETPCSPDEIPQTTQETSEHVQEGIESSDEAPGSPQEPQVSTLETSMSPREIPSSPKEAETPDSPEEGEHYVSGQCTSDRELLDTVTASEKSASDVISSKELEGHAASTSELSEVDTFSEHLEKESADSTVIRRECNETSYQGPVKDERPEVDSSVNLSPPVSPSNRDIEADNAECLVRGDEDSRGGEEDIYSLDLVGEDNATGNSEAVARGYHGKDSLGNDVHQCKDVGDKVSQSVEKKDTVSESGNTAPLVHSSMPSSPHVASADLVSGSSEVSQSSFYPESNVHSTTLPHQSDVSKTSPAKQESYSVSGLHDSGERYESKDIPNGLGTSPDTRDDDVLAGRVQANSNTSFNEEHVELDYDEEEGDDMHGHASEAKEAGEEDERNKEGSGDEKQDGELSSSEEEKDDGELDDDEDCEEGEIREPGGRKPFVKPICRFYTKGNCTWGNNCRFLHPGINDKGNYRLFETPGLNGGIIGLNRRFGQGWGPEPGAEPELPPPPPELPVTESAWERGLRHAKEMRKKATMRKEQETNFEEKRMNLSLDEERDLNKENERSKYVKDPYYDQFDDDEYYGKSQIHGWQAGSYENFEVRWTREPEYPPYPRHEKERERFKERHYSPPVERMERIDRLERQMFDQSPRMRDERRDKYREDRMEPPPQASQIPRGRADEWHDPWQRSKSPKQKRRSSRSHSRGRRRRRSYSVSSHSSSSYSSSRSRSSSYSSHSSRSSYSRSSSFSSRSPSPRPTGSKKNAPHPAEKKQGPPVKTGAGKRPPPFDERKVPPQSRNNTGKRGPTSDERKGPQQTKNNDQPRSAVTVKSKLRSPEKRAGVPPGKPGRHGPPGEDRGRIRDKPPHGQPHPRTVPHSGSRSSSGSSFSRSRSRSSSSSTFSRSGSASSVSSRSKSRSRSRSSSTSSSGSADSEHLYRDLHSNEGRMPSPKKKIPNKEKRPDRGPRHDLPPQRRRDMDQERDRRDDRPRHESRSGMRGNRPQHGRQPTTPVKPKDPLKLVGQKSNIKLTLLNKPPEKSNLIPGAPPVKRRPSDTSGGPPTKRQAMMSPPGAKQPAAEKPKGVPRVEKTKSPPPKDKPASPTKAPSKAPLSASKPPTGPKASLPGIPAQIPPPPAPPPKQKKSMSSRREELLKQLKAVEDAIARKKAKMQ